MRRAAAFFAILLLVIGLVGAMPVRAAAAEVARDIAGLMGSMARFAQPVRVGDLARRYLIRPEYEQGVIGYVAPEGVARDADDALFLVVDWGGVFGLGTTRVVVPLDQTALLGEHVVFLHPPLPALADLPRFDPRRFPVLPADREIRMMIVGPFH